MSQFFYLSQVVESIAVIVAIAVLLKAQSAKYQDVPVAIPVKVDEDR